MSEPPEIHIPKRVWIVRRYFLRHDGWEYCEIVMEHEKLARDAEQNGWTVTEYEKNS